MCSLKRSYQNRVTLYHNSTKASRDLTPFRFRKWRAKRWTWWIKNRKPWRHQIKASIKTCWIGYSWLWITNQALFVNKRQLLKSILLYLWLSNYDFYFSNCCPVQTKLDINYLLSGYNGHFEVKILSIEICSKSKSKW